MLHYSSQPFCSPPFIRDGERHSKAIHFDVQLEVCRKKDAMIQTRMVLRMLHGEIGWKLHAGGESSIDKSMDLRATARKQGLLLLDLWLLTCMLILGLCLNQ